MINKRLLIKNIISHNDEGTFFDKKSKIDISNIPQKAKLLKHICALSNSNPKNDSYIIVGISDDNNEILGSPLIDDSQIQNLVKSTLINSPIVKYENIQFPETTHYRNIGLLTIIQDEKTTSFSKDIWKIRKGSSYYRYGSNSIIIDEYFYINKENISIVESIKKYSINNLKGLLDGVQEFNDLSDSEYLPEYLVFKDQFVICWSAWRENHLNRNCFSEIDIQLINENKKIFISAVQYADIVIDENSFKIIELVPLGSENDFSLYPLEQTSINFNDNGSYSISTEIVFKYPTFPKKEIEELYTKTKKISEQLKNDFFDKEEFDFIEGISNYFLICYLNGIETSKNDLIESIKYLDGSAAEWQIGSMRILDKYEKTTTNKIYKT